MSKLPHFSGIRDGDVLRRWEGHLPDLVSQEELDDVPRWSDADRERANRWLLLAFIGVAGFALAVGGMVALTGWVFL